MNHAEIIELETKYAVITEEDKQKLQEQTELNLSQNYNINLED